MCVKQNAIDFKSQFPNAPKEVQKLFYVNDYLRGADSAEQAIGLPSKLFSTLQVELQWSWIQSIAPKLRDSSPIITLSDSEQYTKTLGIEWNSYGDHFGVPYLF